VDPTALCRLSAGTPLAAVADGTVLLAKDLFFAGNAVFIDHGDGLVSMYFHLAELKVRTGQAIEKGETIGLAGSTDVSPGRTSIWASAGTAPGSILRSSSRIRRRFQRPSR
jgi:septal ring factor EnvC (AmiA/AmiB activator)